MPRTATDVAILSAARALECADRAEDRIADSSIGSSVAAILARCAATEASERSEEVARLRPEVDESIVQAARAAAHRAARSAEGMESVVAERARPAPPQ